MKEDLLDIRSGIKAGHYVNEATVSQGILQRPLNALGWPVYDTEIVAPEYSRSLEGPITRCVIRPENQCTY